MDKNASLPLSELFGVIAYFLALGLWVTPAIRWWSTRRRQRTPAQLRTDLMGS